MQASDFYHLSEEKGQTTLFLKGDWNIRQMPFLTNLLASLVNKIGKDFILDLVSVVDLDTAGAWLIVDWVQTTCKQKTIQVEIKPLPNSHGVIFNRVQMAYQTEKIPPITKPNAFISLLNQVGKAVLGTWNQFFYLMAFLGQTTLTFLKNIHKPKEWHLPDLSRHIEETGISAVPIVSFMAFMIAIVIAYQGAYQLKQFGAEIFTVDLTAIAILREMGVLLTSIMVAGRSGSAFAAELGVMRVNDEIDALRTLGLSPFTVLVLPRMVALIITLPLLTFLSDIMGLLGAAVLLGSLLDISFSQFTHRLYEALSFSTYAVGMIKAPFFAIIISLVGCLRGMQVTKSAASVGQMTTKAVVESILLVMLADALFSILFTWLHV